MHIYVILEYKWVFIPVSDSLIHVQKSSINSALIPDGLHKELKAHTADKTPTHKHELIQPTQHSAMHTHSFHNERRRRRQLNPTTLCSWTVLQVDMQWSQQNEEEDTVKKEKWDEDRTNQQQMNTMSFSETL